MKQGSLLAVLAVAMLSLAGGLAAARAQESVLQISSSGSDIATMDAHRATSTTDKALVGWMYNGLVRFAPGSADPKDIEPDLAERWENSPDRRTWTFFLRKGVQFHGNWGELTADDVVYSLTRSADPKRSTFAADFSGIDSITKVDDHTVRIVLKYPDANFLGRVSNYHGGNIVSKKAAEELGDKFASTPVGAGPFAFAEHVTQQHVKLVAHGGYFRGQPRIGVIMYRMIPSDSARELAFSSGELDVMLFFHRVAPRIGLTISIPSKSLSLSVTSTHSLASATAAIMVSRPLRGRPLPFPSAVSRAQTRPAFSSKERMRPAKRACGPSGPENHDSS